MSETWTRLLRAASCGLAAGVLAPDSLWRAGIGGLLLTTAFILNEETALRRERVR